MDIETSIRTMKNESVKKGMGSSMKLPPDVKRISRETPFSVLIDGECGF